MSNAQHRGPWLLSAVATAVVIGVIILFVAAASSRSANERRAAWRQSNNVRLTQMNIAKTLAEIEQAAARANILLAWLEEREDAGSSDLINVLRTLCDLPDIVVGSEFERELTVMALKNVVVEESCHARMDAQLSPGMWHYIYEGSQGTQPIDFRATLGQLAAAGIEADVRSILRSLQRRRRELNHLHAQAAALDHATATPISK